jgi:hypothetical protein
MPHLSLCPCAAWEMYRAAGINWKLRARPDQINPARASAVAQPAPRFKENLENAENPQESRPAQQDLSGLRQGVFSWRKKWERDWDSVIYCSKRCRTAKPDKGRWTQAERNAR